MNKEKFDAYVAIQKSGQVNMFDVVNVCLLAISRSGIMLNKEDCLDIMKNYDKYKKEFKK